MQDNSSAQKVLDLSGVSNKEILFRLEKLSQSERKLTHLVLCHIIAVEERKLYLDLGFNSLYHYLTQHLNYSESAAYDRIQAARVLKKNPEIAAKLEDGALKLSQLVKLDQSLKQEQKAGKVLSSESTQELLAKLENKSVYETNKILAGELNHSPQIHQKVKPQKDQSVRLELTLTEEQYEILKKAQSLISHSVPENRLAEVISYLAQAYIKKVEGSGKTKAKAEAKTNAKTEAVTKTKASNLTPSFRETPLNPYQTFRRKRKYLSVKIRRAVFAKAHHCCELINPLTGKRCASKFQLQLDHILPLARGGTDEIGNLRVLCGVCNRREALRWGLG